MPQAQKPATTPSLPGALSTRTDGGIASKQAMTKMTGMPYGQNQDYNQIEASAPMAKAEQSKPMSPTQIAGAAQQGQQQPQQPAGPTGMPANLPSLTGPSTRPNEHVTTPAQPQPQVDPRLQENADLVQRYMPDLMAATQIPGAPDSYRAFVNHLYNQTQLMSQSGNQ
jgi:hypothetical protein